jgi:hypothetical protein
MALPKLKTVTYTLKLPSTGNDLNYRPFLVKEQKNLMIAQESEDEKIIQEAVAQTIIDCTFDKIDPWIIPSFDVEYIFLKVRSKSVGDKVNLNILCPDDKKTRVSVSVDLSKIECTMHVGHSNEVELTEDLKLVMKYPTFKDIADDNSVGQTETMFSMISICINQIIDGETIYDKIDMTKEDLSTFIESMTTDHLEKVSEFFESMPTLTHTVKVKNPKTGKTGEVVLEGFESFFE